MANLKKLTARLVPFFIFVINITLTGCSANMTTFEWQATESAPKNYPMEITSGSLIYHDGSGSLYVPNGVTLYNGWGKGRSSHVVGEDFKPLPSRLRISFFSYTEDQFYRGDFELPYEKILALFQAGFYSPNQEKKTTYKKIIVGVAPGGAVSVWLWGYERRTEVFFGQAEKTEGDWKHFTNDADISRKGYISVVIKGSLKTPELIEALHKDGIPFGRWAAYRTRYHWQPLFTNIPLRDKRISAINYYNGEQDYINYPLEKEALASQRPIPNYIYFIWKNPVKDARDRTIRLHFDEAEITSAFQTLGQGNRSLQMEFLINEVEGKNMFTVLLKNDEDSIVFEKTKIEFHLARDYAAEAAAGL